MIDRKLALSDEALGVWPTSIEGFLRSHSWRVTDTLPNAVVWTKAKGRGAGAEVIIPMSRRLSDFELRVNDALDTLARLEGVSVRELISLTRVQQWDTAKLRLVGPGADDGTTPLSSLSQLFAGAKDAVLAAACSATLTRSHFGGRKPAAAVAHLNRVRVAQTELGSYVVNLQAPAWSDEAGGQAPLSAHMAPMPHSRRATLYLARAVSRLSSMVEGQGVVSQEVAESVGVGVTANLCDAITKMVVELADVELEFSFHWAVGVPVPPPVAGRPKFGVAKVPLIRDISQQLRGTEPTNVGTVIGPVVTLHRPLGRAEGTATIEANIDGRARQVKVVLPPGAYLSAIEAHGAERQVRFEGKIVRFGRRWFLENPELVLAPRLIADERPTPGRPR